MKRYFVAAALVVSSLALPNAKANSIIFNFTPTTESSTSATSLATTSKVLSGVPSTGQSIGTYTESYSSSAQTGVSPYNLVAVEGYKCSSTNGGVCASNNDATLAGSSSGVTLYQLQDGVGVTGSGSKYNSGNDIENTYFVQIDFSSLANALKTAGDTITRIVVTGTNIDQSWVLYGSNTFGTPETGGLSYTTTGTSGTGTATLTQAQAYTLTNNKTVELLTITGGSACSVELSGLEIDYTTAAPEPGTLVLMGGALLGLGVAGKKLRRRA